MNKYKAQIIDGRAAAEIIHEQTRSEIQDIISSYGTAPKLSIILAGNNSASEIYVRNKIKAAQNIGMRAELIKFSNNVTNTELLDKINNLNNDNDTSGIIIQLPLPSQINKIEVIKSIDPSKDVDGFHPINVGKLYSDIDVTFIPCTALGCLYLIKNTGYNLEGANVVIIGRSNIVGRPLAALLLRNNCTVTIAHSKTKDLKKLCQRADIVVSAVGKPQFLTKEYFSQHAIVIDVGINRIEYKDKCDIVGDVNFEDVINHVSYITPVPGGVGPMTVAFLLSNCVKAYKLKHPIDGLSDGL